MDRTHTNPVVNKTLHVTRGDGGGGGWAKACECVRKCTLLESGAYYWIEKYAILAGQQPQAHLFSHALESEQCTPTPNGPGASVQAGGLRAAFPVLCAFAALPRAGIWAGAYAPAPALGGFRPALVGVFKHQRQCVLCSKSSPLTHSVMVLHIVPNELSQRDFETYVR